MSIDRRPLKNNNRNIKAGMVTRREFLKETSYTLGGIALTSLVLAMGCDKSSPTETSKNTAADPLASSPGSIPSDTSHTPVAPVVTQWTAAGTPLLDTPNCTTKVAADRVYSIEHVWVKTSSDNIVRIGISDKLQALISTIQNVSLEKTDTIVEPDEYFGSIQALKMNVDLISPVSGKIINSNSAVIGLPSLITDKPYDEGWLLQIQLSKPEELSSLLSPADYVKAIANQVELPPCVG